MEGITKITPIIAAKHIKISPKESKLRYLKLQFYGCLLSGVLNVLHSKLLINLVNSVHFKHLLLTPYFMVNKLVLYPSGDSILRLLQT